MESKTFPCFACSDSFDAADSLLCHVKVLHSSLKITVYVCKVKGCIREFDKVYRYSRHLKLDHKDLDYNQTSALAPKKLKFSIDSICSSNNGLDEVPDIPDISNNDLPQPKELDITLNFFNAVNNAVIKTVAKLYSKDTETRSRVQEIITEMKDLLCGTYMDLLESFVVEALQTSGSVKVSNVQTMFDIVKGMFNDLDTEWKRLKSFREHDVYIDPKQYPVGTALMPKNVKGHIVMESVLLKGSFLSPRRILKMFLELPGVLDQIISYMANLERETDVLSNVVQGSLWKDIIKPKFGDKFVLPLNMSFDDVETNKDLGSHTTVHKLSACHIAIPCLPPAFQSVLENLFLCLLFYATDKHFGLDEVFHPLLDEFKYLEEKGIEIVVNNESKNVFFALCLITGDNLAINTILGLVESFTANYYCRVCRCHKDAMSHDTEERPAFIRDQESHNRHVQRNDPTSTGVKDRCIWDDLMSFKITENLYADIMHDLVGIGNYNMSFIIHYIVKKKKWMTLEEMNDFIQCFDYGSHESGNKPPLLIQDKLDEESLGFSASEMFCFVRYFALIVGHKVPKDDKVWKFYLDFRELCDILLAPTVPRSKLPYLTQLISEQLKDYQTLSKHSLRPKHHKLVHYVRIIQLIGPLKPLWAMRAESKYKELRQAAHVTSSRVLIPHTLAVKSSLKMTERFISKKGLEHRLDFSSHCERIQVQDIDDYVNFSHKLPHSSNPSDYWNMVKWVKIDGTTYKPKMVLVESLGDLFPNFAIVDKIFITDDKKVKFLLKLLQTIEFDAHLHSYQVECLKSWDCYSILDHECLVSFTPAHLRTFFNGQSYVMLRHAL